MPTVCEYLNFDLQIERQGDRYHARVIDSPAGQAGAEFDLPFSDLELDNFFLRVGQPRRQARRNLRLDAEGLRGVVEQFGGRLYEVAFSDEMRSILRSSLDQARAQGNGLRVRLRLNDAPELANLPWEYLYNRALNRFLTLSVQTSLVRYLSLSEIIPPLLVQPPLRMLVMISSPSDMQTLDVEQEWGKLKSALGTLEQQGLIALDRLENGTLAALQRQLRRREYHIFHYIGHGAYDPRSQDGMLLLEGEDKRGRLVSGADLGIMLHDASTLRLVVLNACEGARTSRSDPFAGVAQSVVQQGIPAVIAMQFEITDQAAITFAHEFYAALVDGLPVDGSLTEARKAILAEGNDVEWGTPVLYMRAPEGVLFSMGERQSSLPTTADRSIVVEAPVATDGEIERRLQHDYTEALVACRMENWQEAVRLLRQVLALRPDYGDAAAQLHEAERQDHLASLYATAQASGQAGDWPAALRNLEELAARQAGYRDVATLLVHARQRVQLASLYAEAKQLHGAGQWQAVLNVFARIHAQEPGYPDLQELENDAKRALARAQRKEKLEALYSRAVLELGEGHLTQARELLRDVRDLEPGYRESDALLVRVEQQIGRTQELRPQDEQRSKEPRPQEEQRVQDVRPQGKQRPQATQKEPKRRGCNRRLIIVGLLLIVFVICLILYLNYLS
jgi:tetratricopeptide (TPR) repeat protein